MRTPRSIRRRLDGQILALLGIATLLAAGDPPAPVDFNRDVRPILSANCFPCHGPDEGNRKRGLRLDLRDEALRERPDGVRPIVPGNPDASEVLRRVSSSDADERMPPADHGAALAPEQIDTLRRWIADGAPYAEHWSLVPPTTPPLPAIDAEQPIDRFVRARLRQHGLEPSPPADRATLLRRVSLDLIGLPPSLDELAAFENDPSPDAYDRVVDRLLASPAFGERWAAMWLDLARYADSSGYASDFPRSIWRYRDWVIDAFNANMPFDRFTIEQLAGDLLPEPTPDQLLATAFHRNTLTNSEGGTDDEEFRVAAVKDRAITTMQVWTGLTVGCAQCHSHKFDPISQTEFYQLFAFFNQTEDSDKQDERPLAATPTAEQAAEYERLRSEVERLQTELKTPSDALAAEQRAWERARAERESHWRTLVPDHLSSQGGARLTVTDDGVITAGGPSPERDTYTIAAPLARAATALRLEVLPHDGGPGRAPGIGNVVLNEVRLQATPLAPRPIRGRYLRIENPGPKRILSLAEVRVWSGEVNVAGQGKATQSSTGWGGPAERALDGDTDGDFDVARTTTHTQTEDDPWWEVDLGEVVAIDRIEVWNRTDHGLHTRLARFRIRVLDDQRTETWRAFVRDAPRPSLTLEPATATVDVELAHASATIDEDGWEIGRAIDDSLDARQGWGLSPRHGLPQAAVFELAAPLPAGEQLTVTLAQNFGDHHTLAALRLSTTDAPPPVRQPPAAVEASLAVAPAERDAAQAEALATWYRSISPRLAALRARIADAQRALDDLQVERTPVLRELPPDRHRTTHVLVKGNFLVPAAEVRPDVPARLPPLPEGAPRNRLGLARWLVDPRHPLTARVTVNRFWARLFGRGLVETEENFGSQGSLPSHPDLLDWLAIDFREHGWDVKRLLRTIVTSATYRQSSHTSPEQLAKDPRNVWLGRARRLRLSAEMVRDQALFVSGLLSRKTHGPSVFPPQPEGLWQAAFDNASRKWTTSEGEDRYRRALYTFLRRTVTYPAMATFDLPSRESCTLRRTPTSTPLQALVTLNDPAFVEAAQALARRIVRDGGGDARSRVAHGLRLCLQRAPLAAQVEPLADLFETELAHYRAHPDDATAMATEPLGPLPAGADVAEYAAWTTVANVLLNLDACLVRS